MGLEVRHKRLYAFYNSLVLNVLMCIEVILLCVIGYSRMMVVPGGFAGILLLVMLGYSAWLWIKKPREIVIDKWLADVSAYSTILFLIVLAIDPDDRWWYLVSAACTFIILITALIRKRSQKFSIS